MSVEENSSFQFLRNTEIEYEEALEIHEKLGRIDFLSNRISELEYKIEEYDEGEDYDEDEEDYDEEDYEDELHELNRERDELRSSIHYAGYSIKGYSDYQEALANEIYDFKCTTSVKDCLTILLELRSRYVSLDSSSWLTANFDDTFYESLKEILNNNCLSHKDILIVMTKDVQQALKNDENPEFDVDIKDLYKTYETSKAQVCSKEKLEQFCAEYETEASTISMSLYIASFDADKQEILRTLIETNEIARNRLQEIVDNHLENDYDFESLMDYLKKSEKKNLMNI